MAKSQNYDFMSLDLILRGQDNRRKPLMVFDWIKAAKLIKEHQPQVAEAGLDGDWDYTGGVIYNGKPVTDSYTYLASTWCKPYLVMDGEEYECWEFDSKWSDSTKWPQEALDIL